MAHTWERKSSTGLPGLLGEGGVIEVKLVGKAPVLLLQGGFIDVLGLPISKVHQVQEGVVPLALVGLVQHPGDIAGGVEAGHGFPAAGPQPPDTGAGPPPGRGAASPRPSPAQLRDGLGVDFAGRQQVRRRDPLTGGVHPGVIARETRPEGHPAGDVVNVGPPRRWPGAWGRPPRSSRRSSEGGSAPALSRRGPGGRGASPRPR